LSWISYPSLLIININKLSLIKNDKCKKLIKWKYVDASEICLILTFSHSLRENCDSENVEFYFNKHIHHYSHFALYFTFSQSVVEENKTKKYHNVYIKFNILYLTQYNIKVYTNYFLIKTFLVK